MDGTDGMVGLDGTDGMDAMDGSDLTTGTDGTTGATDGTGGCASRGTSAPADAAAEGMRIPGDPAMGEAVDRVAYAAVTTDEVSVQRMASLVQDPRCGAVVTFDGVVRDHDDGRGVLRLDYSAHPSAQRAIDEVAAEIAARYADVLVAVAHRYGPLTVGESALVCAIAAPHRKLAFAACDDLVDTAKRRLPIWKHQQFADGTDEWVGALG